MQENESEDADSESIETHHDNSSHGEPKHGHKATLIVVLVTMLFMIYYLISDRFTPYTTNARVQAYEVPVIPDVSGYIDTVYVKKNQAVKAGDMFFKIEQRRFIFAVEEAKAQLAIAGQKIGSDTAVVAEAAAKVSEANTMLDEARTQAARVYALEKKGIYPKAEGDSARARVKALRSQVKAAESQLERARQELGNKGQNNPKLRLAETRLEQALLNLSRTELRTASDGYIGSIKLDRGNYVTAGQPIMSFISTTDLWIEAYMSENNLGNIRVGNPVDISLDAYPGRIFKGKVKSLAVAVSTGKPYSQGALSAAPKSTGWLRSPQFFSVIISLKDYQLPEDQLVNLRHNGQADVVVYTSDSSILNSLAHLWLRLMSMLSFAY
ncbi:HlyD family secretion protein [Photobacterium minamisatsumaniensis]|uniref:HlyD family secretion protein n=1 Tax=Photobacterium minamisatsumaniensis TaxID=2910233 RepID=UPI003D147939